MRHEGALRETVEARSRDRLKYLQTTLIKRRDSEINDILAVLDELRQGIQMELVDTGPQYQQLSLWSENERNQVRRDQEALKARLDRIPEERRSEKAAIEKYYADSADRTFPVAVIFLVPLSMLEKGGSL